MADRYQVDKVKELLTEIVDKSLPALLAKSADSSTPKLFKNGIKDVSVSITVGPVALSLTLGGEDN